MINLFAGELFRTSKRRRPNKSVSPGPFTLTIDGKPKATSVKVSWTASSGTKGYVIQLWTSVPNGSLAATYLLAPDYSSFTFKNLTPNTQDTIQVFAYNASGSYAPSVEFITPKR